MFLHPLFGICEMQYDENFNIMQIFVQRIHLILMNKYPKILGHLQPKQYNDTLKSVEQLNTKNIFYVIIIIE